MPVMPPGTQPTFSSGTHKNLYDQAQQTSFCSSCHSSFQLRYSSIIRQQCSDALSPDAFQKLSILNMYQIRKENSTYREIATDWNIILDYLITTENGNLLLDQIRQYATSCNTNISNSYCYHALLTGKEKHGCNTIKDLNSLSAILKSLDELQIYMSNLNVEKYRAKFYDLKATFLETENIPNKKAPNTN